MTTKTIENNLNWNYITQYTCTSGKKRNLRLGIAAITNPLRISNPPTVRRYHFDGILMSNKSDNGNTFEYFTYSFLCETNKRKDKYS